MKIFILPEVYNKIMFFVDKTDFEVSGFGLVEHVREHNYFVVTDCFLVKQDNTAAHTDIDGQDLAKLLYQTKDMGGSLRFWWHSHVNMGAFWSSQDITTIKELGANGWITAGVFNQKREHKAAVCWQSTSDLGTSVQLNDSVELVVGTPYLDQTKIDQWEVEFKEKVTEKRYQAHAWSQEYWQGQHAQEKQTQKEVKKDQEKTAEAVNDTNIEREFMIQGLIGYGARAEAEALGISLEKYKNIYFFGTDRDYDDILTELRLVEQTGEFSHGWGARC